MRYALPVLPLLLLLAACGEPSGARTVDRGVEADGDAPPDFLLVTVDTLRSDFLGCYGHATDPTPRLTALAGEGAVFERHYSVMSHTAPAHATLFTGLAPRRHGVRKNSHTIPERAVLLAEVLRGAGYQTSAVVAASFLSTRGGFDRGFEVFDEDFGEEDVFRERKRTNSYQRDAEQVTEIALDLLRRGDGRPRFLWVHMYDPHGPYEPPDEHRVDLDVARETYRDHGAVAEGASLDELVSHFAAYEGEVRFVDAQLARLLEAWDSHPRGREGLVVVTSDHGEGLGEHHVLGHGVWNYEEQLLVPLIARMPSRIEPGTRAPGPTSHIDLAATFAELLGLEAVFEGQSLVPRLGSDEPASEGAVLAERRIYNPRDWQRREDLAELLVELEGRPGVGRGDQIALVRGRYKYIWTEDAPDELYDLDADPEELVELSAELPDVAADMRAYVDAGRRRRAGRRAQQARARGPGLLAGQTPPPYPRGIPVTETTPFDLSGRVAVVTGGARGIGLAITHRFARNGAAVAIADRDADAGAAAVAEIEAAGGRAISIALDVTDEAQVEAMTQRVVDELGRYDVLVCSAGIVGRNAFAWETSADEWREVLEINLTGVWLCNKHALTPMRAANYGRIVNIASISGKEGNPKLGPYSASKAGVIGMTKSLAKEIADTEIRVHSVAPAVIHTPMLDQVNQETIDYMVSKIPVGRTGTTEEVAALVHYLSSEECSFTTGACFDISGGRATY